VAFLISVQDVIVKWFDGVMPLWQLFALRGLFSAPFLAFYTWFTLKSAQPLVGTFDRGALLRTLRTTTWLFGFYAALPFYQPRNSGAGIYLAPIFMTLLLARFSANLSDRAAGSASA
jgi:hypothetical protein